MPKDGKTSDKKNKLAGNVYGQDLVVGSSIGEFFNICKKALLGDETYWFRGHADISWDLTPSALRYKTVRERNRALGLLDDFKRYGEIKLANAPSPDEDLKWMQLAQHYGLPTRLLDWTKNASIALYFACQNSPDDPNADGGVIVLNPIDLNRAAEPKRPRILNPHNDSNSIRRYLRLSGQVRSNGILNVAINPVWNSERIMLQQGVFTLHGSRNFAITLEQTPMLLCLRIRKKCKEMFLKDLERVGINEMSIFPEAEHMCNYLKWKEKLLLEEK